MECYEEVYTSIVHEFMPYMGEYVCVCLHQTHRFPTYYEGMGWIAASHFRSQAAGFWVFDCPKSTSLWENLDSSIFMSLLSCVLLLGLTLCAVYILRDWSHGQPTDCSHSHHCHSVLLLQGSEGTSGSESAMAECPWVSWVTLCLALTPPSVHLLFWIYNLPPKGWSISLPLDNSEEDKSVPGDR